MTTPAPPLKLEALPDPHDRTANNPAVLLSSAEVRRLYEAVYSRRCPSEVTAFADQMIEAVMEYGWSQARFYGGQLLLVANIQLS